MVAWAAVALLASVAAPDASTPSTPGWSAVQTHIGPDGEPAGTSRLTYRDHRLRIEDGTRVAILELTSGAMTLIDPATHRWARVTLDELVRARDAQLAELKARIQRLPPAVREPLQRRLERDGKEVEPKLVPTDEERVVNGYACRVHRWSRPGAEGRACLAPKLPVDVSAFRTDLKQLGTRMTALGAGAVGSIDFLRLSARGFPVRTQQQVDVGGRTIEAASEVSGFEPASPNVRMEPPPDYRQVEFEALVTSMAPNEAQ